MVEVTNARGAIQQHFSWVATYRWLDSWSQMFSLRGVVPSRHDSVSDDDGSLWPLTARFQRIAPSCIETSGESQPNLRWGRSGGLGCFQDVCSPSVYRRHLGRLPQLQEGRGK